MGKLEYLYIVIQVLKVLKDRTLAFTCYTAHIQSVVCMYRKALCWQELIKPTTTCVKTLVQ